MKKISLYLVVLVALVVLLGAVTMFFGGTSVRQPVHAQTTCLSGETTCLSGWAWSSNIGWISFNSNDTGAGGPYDVAIDGSGNLTGYAWSSNVGWISFNPADLTGCPATNGVVVNTVSGSVTGWIRAVVAKGRTDGWDGCIELSGTNHETGDATGAAGVTFDSGSKQFKGYAWGGPVVGWLQFSPLLGTGPVTCEPECPVTVNDLSLQAEGKDAGGNSVWGTSVYVQAQADGTASVPVRWAVGDATNIQIVSATGVPGSPTDWGVNSGSTQTSSGQLVTVDNVNNPDTVNFSSTGTKQLYLSYRLSGAQRTTMITIVVNSPSSTVVCTAPGHASLCSQYDENQSPLGVSDAGSCNVNQCNFYCDSGYKLNASKTACVKSSIEEI